jgi:hypothetical protein
MAGMTDRLDAVPGGALVRGGLADLAAGRVSQAALLVSIGASRLRAQGIAVPSPIADADHRLYLLLYHEHGNAAHGRYNALLRELVSCERALECAS